METFVNHFLQLWNIYIYIYRVRFKCELNFGCECEDKYQPLIKTKMNRSTVSTHGDIFEIKMKSVPMAQRIKGA